MIIYFVLVFFNMYKKPTKHKKNRISRRYSRRYKTGALQVLCRYFSEMLAGTRAGTKQVLSGYKVD